MGCSTGERKRCTLWPSSFRVNKGRVRKTIAGRWFYLFRAVDSDGDTVDFYLSEKRDREAAKAFLEKALWNPDNRAPRVLCMDGSRSYPAAIRELCDEGQ